MVFFNLEQSVTAHTAVLSEARAIYREREKLRRGAWQEFDTKDSLHHVRSKLARVEAMCAALRDGDLPASVTEEDLRREIANDTNDLINYAVFTRRHVEEGRY